jgi:hypothetical protein
MHVFSKMFAWLFSIRSHTVPRPRRRGTRLLHTVHGGDTTNQMADVKYHVSIMTRVLILSIRSSRYPCQARVIHIDER